MADNDKKRTSKYYYPTGKNEDEEVKKPAEEVSPSENVEEENKKPQVYNPYVEPEVDLEAERAEQLKELNRKAELEELNQKLLKEEREQPKSTFSSFFTKIGVTFLVLILVTGIGFSAYFFAKSTGMVSGGGIIKLSVALTDNLENISPENQEISLTEVYPGDKYGIKCIIRNADNIMGDDDNSGESIFVRYSVALEIDEKRYTDIVVPVVSDLAKQSWHIYDPDEETSSYIWDGYIYYYGAVKSDQALTIFEEIKFDFYNTGNEFGNKEGKLVVVVEAIKADVENLGTDGNSAWSSAPKTWITNMQNSVDNSGNRITI